MAIKYPIYNLAGSGEFEDFVIEIGSIYFGAGIKKFSTGKDGGRDSRFPGVAEKYPATNDPWKDKTIIQTKFHKESKAKFF